jgi:lipopolysaccharide transport system ATP-binding protein
MNQTIIHLDGVSKDYKIYAHDFDRVREIISGKPRHQLQCALQDVSLDVREGEVVGVVGRNGAGKSTLLKVLANTLQPSTGVVDIRGRIAALLELGGSFHPEMSGHDNIYLYCSIQGMSKSETDAIYEEVVEFSGIREFIHRPVKTYSSGMFVRLAFAAAINVNPDILIVDEALSVGDGIFARRSFERIMRFKQAGKTIFFCSHSLYQVEALCDRVIWIEEGRVMQDGDPSAVITRYGEFLNKRTLQQQEQQDNTPAATGFRTAPVAPTGEVPRIMNVTVAVDGVVGRSHHLHTDRNSLEITVRYYPGRDVPLPSIGVVLSSGDGNSVTSAGSVNDGVSFKLDAQGLGTARITFPQLALLKGYYMVDVYLMCEQGVHIYEKVKQAAELNVEQKGLARGYVNLPHRWG